jgi:hypothetical protein
MTGKNMFPAVNDAVDVPPAPPYTRTECPTGQADKRTIVTSCYEWTGESHNRAAILRLLFRSGAERTRTMLIPRGRARLRDPSGDVVDATLQSESP